MLLIVIFFHIYIFLSEPELETGASSSAIP